MAKHPLTDGGNRLDAGVAARDHEDGDFFLDGLSRRVNPTTLATMNGEPAAVLQGGVLNRSESDGKLNVRVWCAITFWPSPNISVYSEALMESLLKFAAFGVNARAAVSASAPLS